MRTIKVNEAQVGQFYVTDKNDELKIVGIKLHEDSFKTVNGCLYTVHATELTMEGGFTVKMENDCNITITEDYGN